MSEKKAYNLEIIFREGLLQNTGKPGFEILDGAMAMWELKVLGPIS